MRSLLGNPSSARYLSEDLTPDSSTVIVKESRGKPNDTPNTQWHVAQLVGQSAVNRSVEGSSPSVPVWDCNSTVRVLLCLSRSWEFESPQSRGQVQDLKMYLGAICKRSTHGVCKTSLSEFGGSNPPLPTSPISSAVERPVYTGTVGSSILSSGIPHQGSYKQTNYVKQHDRPGTS